MIDPRSEEPFSSAKWPVLMLGVLAIGWLALRSPASATSPHASRIAWTGFGLLAAGVVLSALTSAVPWLGLRAGLRHLALAALVPLLVRCPMRAADVRWLARALVYAASAQAALMLLQWVRALAGGGFPVPPGLTGRAAMVGSLGNPEYAASFVALGMAAWFGMAWARQCAASASSPTFQSTWAPLLMTPALLLGGGRAAALCLLAAACIAWLRQRRAAPGPLFSRRTLVIAGATLAVLAIGYALLPASLRSGMLPSRIADLFDPQSTSMRHRIGLLVVSSHLLADHVLLGVGGGQFGAAFARELAAQAAAEPGLGYWAYAATLRGTYVLQAHCDPLQWWIEYGLLGWLGLALLACAALLRGARAAVRRDLLALWLPLLTLAFNAWLAFPLHEPMRAYCAWLLAAALLASHPAPQR